MRKQSKIVIDLGVRGLDSTFEGPYTSHTITTVCLDTGKEVVLPVSVEFMKEYGQLFIEGNKKIQLEVKVID